MNTASRLCAGKPSARRVGFTPTIAMRASPYATSGTGDIDARAGLRRGSRCRFGGRKAHPTVLSRPGTPLRNLDILWPNYDRFAERGAVLEWLQPLLRLCN